MNNNQGNLSTNPQATNINNQFGSHNNPTQPLNVMSQNNTTDNQNLNQGITPLTTEKINEPNYISNQNNFNNNQNNNPFGNNLNQQPIQSNNSENDILLIKQKSRFINNEISENTTTLNNLNVESNGNNNAGENYIYDPKVQENLNKKNTITITSEGKIFIIIIIILLLFTFVMPYIFNFIRNIKY